MGNILKYYWPAVLWAFFIFIMCTIDLGSLPASPLFFPGFDKLVHCGFYFVFVVFLCSGFIRQNNPQYLPYIAILSVVVLATVFGGVIELLQLWVFTWRDGEWGDLFADATGACMGGFSALIIFSAVKYGKK